MKKHYPIWLILIFFMAPNVYSEVYKIVSKHESRCLRYNGSGSGIRAQHACGYDTLSNYYWDIQTTGDLTPNGQEIVNIYSIMNYGCIVDGQSHKYAPLEYPCPSYEARARWVFNKNSIYLGEQMYTVQSQKGQCLNVGRNSGKIYALNCTGDFDQLWYLSQ